MGLILLTPSAPGLGWIMGNPFADWDDAKVAAHNASVRGQKSSTNAPNQPATPRTEKKAGESTKKGKYGNRKVEIDGITFDSEKEGDRYCRLKMLEKAGIISDLTLQKHFVLAPSVYINGRKKPELKYIADFVYLQGAPIREAIVEDCKGFRDALYKAKRHLMKSVHNIDILET